MIEPDKVGGHRPELTIGAAQVAGGAIEHRVHAGEGQTREAMLADRLGLLPGL